MQIRQYGRTDFAIRKDVPTGPFTEEEVLFAELCRKDIVHLIRYMWQETDGSVPLYWNWHLDNICGDIDKVMNGDIQFLLANIPPGTMKSRVVSVFWNLWAWLPGNWPSHKFLCVSGSGRVSNRDAVLVKDMCTTPRYRRLCEALTAIHEAPEPTRPWPWDLSKGSKERTFFTNTEGGNRRSVTVLSRFTGLRGDIILFDDPYDADDVLKGDHERITERMSELQSMFVNKLMNRRNNEEADPIVLIMQRLHNLDLSQFFQDQYSDNPKFRAHIYPMEFDPEIACATDPRTVEGELLFPARFSQEAVDEKAGRVPGVQGMSHGQYPAQYGQRPVAGSGGIFKLSYMQHRYKWQEDWRSNRALPVSQRVTLSIDTASTANTRSNPSAWNLFLEDAVGTDWLLAVEEEKVELPDLIKKTRDLIDRHRPDVVLIEEMGNGIALAIFVEAEYPQVTVVRVKPQRVNGFKEMRASNTTDRWEAGKVRLPDEACPKIAKYERQHLSFPRGANDDHVDATAQYIMWKKENRDGLFQHRVAGVMDDVYTEFHRAEDGSMVAERIGAGPARVRIPLGEGPAVAGKFLEKDAVPDPLTKQQIGRMLWGGLVEAHEREEEQREMRLMGLDGW